MKKIIGIFIVMMFIGTAVLSATSSINVFNSSLFGEVKDQYVEWDAEVDQIIDFDWQEFVPTMVRHTRIEVKIVQWYGGSNDLKLSIESPLGTILRYKELSVNDIPGYCDWVSFDIQDIDLVPGQSYYIKLTAPLGSEYGWGSSPRDPYPQGDSSKGSGTGWDWCFRTYCMENTPPNKPDTPSGATSGKTGTSYSYSSSTIDLEGDQVYYWFDWGDGSNSGWDGPHNSGDVVSLSHSWSADGTYPLKIKAKDISDVESVWSDPLSVSMPKNKQYMPLGIILAFGFDVDVKIVQLEPGEDYVDLEVLNKPFYIWQNEIVTINPGAFVRLIHARGLFTPSLPLCMGLCNDWGIIG